MHLAFALTTLACGTLLALSPILGARQPIHPDIVWNLHLFGFAMILGAIAFAFYAVRGTRP